MLSFTFVHYHNINCCKNTLIRWIITTCYYPNLGLLAVITKPYKHVAWCCRVNSKNLAPYLDSLSTYLMGQSGIYFYDFTRIPKVKTVVGLHSKILDVYPSWSNFLCFMRFSGQFGQIIVWRALWVNTSLWEILDPPLVKHHCYFCIRVYSQCTDQG